MVQPKYALITGAASGIGAEITRTLYHEGYNIIAVDLNRPEYLNDLYTVGQSNLFVNIDLSNPQQCQSLVGYITGEYGPVDGFGPIDVLVNNAGFQHVSPLEEFPESTWGDMLQVMLTAPFLLTKAVLPVMKERRYGRIINIGSIHSQVASLNKAGYITAKHGLVGLTKATALEAGPYQITANVICPSYVRTPLVEEQIADQAETLGISTEEVESEVFLKASATGKMIEPSEVASMVSFLCSENAKSITGSCWTVDGGWTAQ